MKIADLEQMAKDLNCKLVVVKILQMAGSKRKAERELKALTKMSTTHEVAYSPTIDRPEKNYIPKKVEDIRS